MFLADASGYDGGGLLHSRRLRTRVDEFGRVKEGQVLCLFAKPDVLDREIELLADGDYHAAFGRAVQLGEHDARTTRSIGKPLAWLMPFWPAVASRTSRTSCGASGICLPITRRILDSWFIKLAWVCSRPAVSTMQISAPVSSARATARWATLAGSPPGPL